MPYQTSLKAEQKVASNAHHEHLMWVVEERVEGEWVVEIKRCALKLPNGKRCPREEKRRIRKNHR